MTPTERLRELAHHHGVHQISCTVLDDWRFPIWSGSSKPEQHHYGQGGLAQHTLEVVELCLLNNGYFPEDKRVTEDTLFLAALFHDAGKMWDYAPTDIKTPVIWGAVPHKDLVHHISRSALVWSHACEKRGYSERIHDDVLHAILAHHGRREWGSPVTPQTRLAWLLHLSDCLSARIDDCVR